MMATVFNALHGINEYGEETTYRMNGIINVQGYPEVRCRTCSRRPTADSLPRMLAALSHRRSLRTNLRQSVRHPRDRGVKLDFDLVRERRWARLESARTDVTEARPGDEIIVEAVLGHIAESASCGRSRFTFRLPPPRARCAFWSAMATRSTACAAGSAPFGRKLDLASTIALAQQGARQQPRVCLAAGSRPGGHGSRQSHAHPAAVRHERDGWHAQARRRWSCARSLRSVKHLLPRSITWLPADRC